MSKCFKINEKYPRREHEKKFSFPPPVLCVCRSTALSSTICWWDIETTKSIVQRNFSFKKTLKRVVDSDTVLLSDRWSNYWFLNVSSRARLCVSFFLWFSTSQTRKEKKSNHRSLNKASKAINIKKIHPRERIYLLYHQFPHMTSPFIEFALRSFSFIKSS